LFNYHDFKDDIRLLKIKLPWGKLYITSEQERKLESCFKKISEAKDLNIETAIATSELKADYTMNPVV